MKHDLQLGCSSGTPGSFCCTQYSQLLQEDGINPYYSHLKMSCGKKKKKAVSRKSITLSIKRLGVVIPVIGKGWGERQC